MTEVGQRRREENELSDVKKIVNIYFSILTCNKTDRDA